jgi:hypothetical protein
MQCCSIRAQIDETIRGEVCHPIDAISPLGGSANYPSVWREGLGRVVAMVVF